MKLYITYLKLHLKTLFEYKLSLILSIIAQTFIIYSFYFSLDSLFRKFNNIGGYTKYEVLLTFAIVFFGYSVNEVFARGIDQFDELIVTGDFDRLLTRPKSIILQVLGYKIQYIKIVRLLFSLVVLIISITHLGIKWNIIKVITLLFMLLSSIAIFFSIFLIAASYCFITVQGLEVRNLLTDGGKNIAQYPMGVFNKAVRNIFTFIIPYSLVNYYPLLYILDKTNNIYNIFLPLLVFIYIIPCILIFNKGTKKYLSTGS